MELLIKARELIKKGELQAALDKYLMFIKYQPLNG